MLPLLYPVALYHLGKGTCKRAPSACPCAGEEDVPVPSVGPDGSFYCAEIRASGLPVGEGIPSEDDLFAGLNCQKGKQQAKLAVVSATGQSRHGKASPADAAVDQCA